MHILGAKSPGRTGICPTSRHDVLSLTLTDPIIFRGLKSITLEDTQQRSLLRLAQHGISVYSPHTAVDTVPGGMADWLCDVVTGAYPPSDTTQPTTKPCTSTLYSAPTYPQPEAVPTTTQSNTQIPHTKSTIHPSPPASIPEGFESAGAGRLVTFTEAQPLTTLIDHIARGVGLPGGIPIATPQTRSIDDIHIRTVGLCPGSGSSVLLRSDSNHELPDLLLTGEMSHHETLAATEQGATVIALAHSNSERGYLRAVMQRMLVKELSMAWQREREAALRAGVESAKQAGAAPGSAFEEVYRDGSVDVSVSEADRDPYGIMVWRPT